MDCSTPGTPVHHQRPEFTQTHPYWVSDAIQPFHPLSPPFPPTFNLSQHQGLYKWVSSLNKMAKVLEFRLQQHQSFRWIFKTDFLQDGLVGTPCSPRDSQESSPTPQFKEASILRHSAFNNEIRLITFFAAKDGEALYSQQKQDWQLTVAQIMNSLLQNSDLNWRK